MSKSIPPAERDLFREAVADAEPLAHEAAEPHRRRPPPRPRPRPEAADEEELAYHLSEAEVATHDYLEFARAGVQRRVMQELQRGGFAIGLEVDLHGLTAELARETLREFLRECTARRVRCARIIHGKGAGSGQPPVLKRKVNYWLRLRPEVLAFCSATRRDGGTGAVYVLLRNPAKVKRDRHRG
ncbi:Smr/MutS family protein [Thiococcus pfennigii]|jgi:DNA-nicking Smr family endonuclease|uniref:Smr/MutS family protein n=1 Tax=Thiococcus pfennigii TaxID=1057 RepID=UPI001903359C|nr:Smr/MutS family protein [Thiococcus pfennigii]MBK1700149.1 DNA mismatch repair protein MutS [Thiococcus pfennigii]MBK1731139.1 DNA mismatch repair protein MutS [Thiococcus pfennigii]